MPIDIKKKFTRMLAFSALCGVFIPTWAWAEPDDAPAVPTSRVQLTEEQYLEFWQPSPAPGATYLPRDSAGGGGSLSATVYFRPLRDDNTPRQLQPFLQRASTFWLQGRGSTMDNMYSGADQPGGAVLRKQLGVSMAVDAYVRDFFVISAALGANFLWIDQTQPGQAPTQDRLIELLPVSVGVGMRTGDTRFDVSYQIVPVALRSAATLMQGSQVAAAVRTVLKRRVDLSLRAALLDQGAAITAGIGLFPTRDFGVFGSVFIGHGRMDTALGSLEVSDRIAGRVGISYWLARTLGASLSYAPTFISATGNLMDHVFALTLDSRL